MKILNFKTMIIIESIILISVYLLFIIACFSIMDYKDSTYLFVVSNLAVYGSCYGIMYTLINCKESLLI